MAYQRKTYDEYDIVTNYGYGWEVECTEPTLAEAKRTKKEYIENAAGLLGIKIVKRRVRLEAKKERRTMKKTETKITRYEAKGYYIDIIENDKMYEAMLTRKGYGVSMYMFGVLKDETSIDEFIEVIEKNLDDDIAIYEMDHPSYE